MRILASTGLHRLGLLAFRLLAILLLDGCLDALALLYGTRHVTIRFALRHVSLWGLEWLALAAPIHVTLWRSTGSEPEQSCCATVHSPFGRREGPQRPGRSARQTSRPHEHGSEAVEVHCSERYVGQSV